MGAVVGTHAHHQRLRGFAIHGLCVLGGQTRKPQGGDPGGLAQLAVVGHKHGQCRVQGIRQVYAEVQIPHPNAGEWRPVQLDGVFNL